MDSLKPTCWVCSNQRTCCCLPASETLSRFASSGEQKGGSLLAEPPNMHTAFLPQLEQTHCWETPNRGHSGLWRHLFKSHLFPKGLWQPPAEAQESGGLPPLGAPVSLSKAGPGKPCRGCQSKCPPPGLTLLWPLTAQLVRGPGNPQAPHYPINKARVACEVTQLRTKGGGRQAQGGGSQGAAKTQEGLQQGIPSVKAQEQPGCSC